MHRLTTEMLTLLLTLTPKFNESEKNYRSFLFVPSFVDGVVNLNVQYTNMIQTNTSYQRVGKNFFRTNLVLCINHMTAVLDRHLLLL